MPEERLLDDHANAAPFDLLLQNALNFSENGSWFRHAAGTVVTAGDPSFRRTGEENTALPERFDVFPSGRMHPHLGIHRGGQQRFSVEGCSECGQGIIGNAVGKFGDEVRRGGDDGEEIAL